MRFTRFSTALALGGRLLLSQSQGAAQDKPSPPNATTNSPQAVIMMQPQPFVEYRVEARVSPQIGNEILFYKGAEGSTQPIFSYDDSDHLLYMFPAWTYSDLVLTVWEGGSHEAVRVFRIKDGTVVKVFDEAARILPEILTGPGSCVIIVGVGHDDRSMDHAQIYDWNGTQMVLAKTVPFTSRYSALRDLMSVRAGKAPGAAVRF